MKLKDIFEISQGTRKLLAITISVTLSAIVFAYFYYRGMNRSEDPRIMEAKELLLEYEKMTRGISGIESFYILDSAFAIFSSIPDYDGSYEKGVIYNNKCRKTEFLNYLNCSLHIVQAGDSWFCDDHYLIHSCNG